MKISKLYIRGFGKIENFELNLTESINVIYGHNESGKSTLMAFIKAVLFGLRGGRADKEGTAAEIRRFKPWNSLRYGGYINFEMDGSGIYRLDRDFDSNSVKLYDQNFNDITGAFSGTKDGKGIAEKLFGINESLFERTVFIRQLGTKIDAASSKELIEKISNIGQSGYGDLSYKTAYSALKEALKSQVGTGRSFTRPLDVINSRLAELSQMIKKLREEEESESAAKNALKCLEAEITDLAHKEKLFSMAVDFLEIKERLELHREKSEEIRFLNNGISLLQRNLKKLFEDKTELDQQAVKAMQEENKLKADLDKIDLSEVDCNFKRHKKSVRGIEVFGAAALVSSIACIYGTFILDRLPVYVAAIPALVFLTAGVLRVLKGSSLKALKREQSDMAGRMKLFQQQLENIREFKAMTNNQLSGLDQRIAIEKIQCEEQLKRLDNIKRALSRQELDELESKADGASMEIIKLLEMLTGTLRGNEAILIESVLEDSADSTKQDLNRLQQFYAQQLQQKKVERAALEYQLKKKDGTTDLEAVEQELYKLSKQKKTLEQRGEALELAMATLEEASQEVQKNFLPVMNKAFSTTFSELTSLKYPEARAGDNLKIMLGDQESETLVPVSALSNGTIDQLYLALRVVVSETVLGRSEGLPLILDEPFAQYDDDRTENALVLINKLSRKQQVLIFTCKQREVEMIKELTKGSECKICSLT